MKHNSPGGTGSAPELTISSITGSVTKDSPDVYITFRVGDEHAETSVIKNAGDTLHWTEPVTVAAGELGGRSQSMSSTGPQLIVRAYDKKPLMPDSLLGEAKVALSELSLGDSHVAGSGGGQNVQVQLLGKKDDFGGELRFTVTSTEGLTVPGGTTWGPQEVHDKQGAGMVAAGGAAGAAVGAGVGATSGQSMSPKAGDHGTTGFQGGGATAFPAQDSGKLKGEHLSDFGEGTASAGGLTAERSGDHGTAGFGGGGATAFPAQASGKDLRGEHLSDFDKSKAAEAGAVGGLAAGAAGAAAAASRDRSDPEAGFAGESAADQQGGESLVDKLKTTLGLGGSAAATSEQPAEQSTLDSIKTTLGFGGGGATTGQSSEPSTMDTIKNTLGLGGGTAAATTEQSAEQAPKEQGSVGATTGVAGGGAEARPAEASGRDLGGERLADFEQGTVGGSSTGGATTGIAGGGAEARPAEASGRNLGGERLADFEQDRRSNVATAPGAAPTAAFAAAGSAATIGAVAAAQGADDMGTGTGIGHGTGAALGGIGSGTGGTGAESTVATAGSFNDNQSEEQRKGALFLAAGAAGVTHEGGLDTATAPGGGTGTGYAADPTETNAAARGTETGITTSYTPGSTATGGPAPGTTVSAKDLATDSTKRGWAAQENAPLAGDTVADAQRTPAPLAGGGDLGDDRVLRISGVSGKLAREEDFLGHVTPYLVFEVGRERETTGTLKKGVRSGEELHWEDELQLELGDGAADQELHIIAYDKKHLLPDSRLGDAVAPLNQLPRGRSARLNLLHRRTRGNIAGHVDFTLSGGGPGGEGAGNDVGFVEGAETLNVAEHDAVGKGEKLPLDQRKPGVITPEDQRRADAEDGGAQQGMTE